MIIAAQLVHGLDQRPHVFRRRELRNPVTKVEHMSGAMAVRGQNPSHLRADLFRPGE